MSDGAWRGSWIAPAKALSPEVGTPGESDVSGGIVTIAPGKGSLATFSPPLDAAGNSVRGIRATRHLSNKLGLNLFASTVQ